MGKITTTIDIAAAPDAVWEQLSTPANFEKWLTIHTKWKSAPEKFEKGSTAAEVVTMMGMPNTIEWTVEEFDEASRLKISGTGMAGVRTSFDFGIRPSGDAGSTASIEAEFEGTMIKGAMGKAIEKDAKQNLTTSLEKLSALVA